MVRQDTKAGRKVSFPWSYEKCLWGDVCNNCKDSGEEVKYYTEKKPHTNVKYKRLHASGTGGQWLEGLKGSECI